MAWLPIVRLVTFGRLPHSISRRNLLKSLAAATVSLLAVVVMSIGADLIAISEPFYFKFAALALATSLLTLLTVIPMYALALGQVRSLLE